MKDDIEFLRIPGSITLNDTLRDLILEYPELKDFIENACGMDIVDENDEKVTFLSDDD